jgi:hypothetical protein
VEDHDRGADAHAAQDFSFVYDGGTKSGALVGYSFVAKPGRTTTYQFLYGQSRSPQTTVKVRPAVTMQALPVAPEAGATVTFSGTVRPLAKAGRTVNLQRLNGSAWQTVAQATIAADGSYSAGWVAQTGSHQFRASVPAGDQMIAGFSPTVRVDVP